MPKKAPVKKVVVQKDQALVAASKKAVKKAPAKKVAPNLTPAKKDKSVELEKVSNEREVIYDKPTVCIKMGDEAITADYAKKLLGWHPVEKDYNKDVKALFGAKAILRNNIDNRPIYPNVVWLLVQEIMRKRWRLNFETIIIGKTGLVLNGQHSLLAVIIAAYLWNAKKEDYPEWETEPTIEKLVGFGCDETPEVVNTMDTCKNRSVADCVFRSHLFKGVSNKDKKILSKMTEFAVRQIWHRIGVGHAFSPGLKGTNTEFINFINKNPKILECVKFVFVEEGEDEDKGKISKIISCGIAAGLLFLMGCSASNPTAFKESDDPNEDMLDWKLQDKAEEYIVMLAGRDKSVKPVISYIGNIIADDDSSMASKVAVVVKGWNLFIKDEPIAENDLLLKYTTEDGIRGLGECPVVGGLDIGSPKELRDNDPDLNEDEVAKGKAEVDATNQQPKASTKKATKKVAPKNHQESAGPIALGEEVWVNVGPGQSWKGTLKEFRGSSKGIMARIEVADGFAGAGTIEECPKPLIQREQPDD